MNNKEPLVTIGVASYNNAKYIRETLDSVVNQTYKNIEIIIVDDNSTDNSKNVIKDWIQSLNGSHKVKLFENSCNLGITKVCSVMLKNATGKYLSFFSSDDIMLSNKISDLVQVLEKVGNDVAGVFSIADEIDENGKLIPSQRNIVPILDKTKEELFEQLAEFMIIHTLTTLMNIEKMKEVGGFNENYWYEDHDLFLRILRKYRLIYVPILTVYYRIHATQSKKKFNTIVNIDKARLLFEHYYNVRKYRKAFKNGILRPLKQLSYVEVFKLEIVSLYMKHFITFFDPRVFYFLSKYIINTLKKW